jgi:hypothetical protein
MKRLLFSVLLSSTILLSGCDTLKTVASSLGLSEVEMASGLREALTQGLFRGFDGFANSDQGNPLVRFAFPGEAAKIENTLRNLGLTSLVNQVTYKFTDAMSLAVREAKPIFINSVKRMNIRDAATLLLTNNRHAATEYFKASMSPDLMMAFRPIADSAIRTTGANRDYKSIVNAYNSIPFLDKKMETNLNDFIAARAIDAMFLYVANEEENIRTKLEYRKTDVLQRVFGYADQQMRMRGSGY